MASGFKVGTFNKSTNTSTPVDQAVTGVGFTPKLLILYSTAETAEGYQANATFGMGFTSGASASESLATEFTDNVSTTDVDMRWQSKALCIKLIQGVTVDSECDLKTFDSDGFTLTWTTNSSSAYKIHYIAFGGPDITNTKVLFKNDVLGTGNKAYTGMGFQPDILFILAPDLFARITGSAGAGQFAFGAGISSTKRWAISMSTRNAQTMTTLVDALTYQRTDSILLTQQATGAERNRYDLVSLDSDGYTLNQVAQITQQSHVAIGIKGGSWDVGSFVKSTSAAPVDQSVTGLAFAPDGYILMNGQTVAASTSPLAGARMFIGASDGTNEITGGAWEEDATIPTEANSTIVSTKVFRNSTGASTTKNEADHKTLNSDGFTITWSTNDTANNPTILWVATKLAAPAAAFIAKSPVIIKQAVNRASTY